MAIGVRYFLEWQKQLTIFQTLALRSGVNLRSSKRSKRRALFRVESFILTGDNSGSHHRPVFKKTVLDYKNIYWLDEENYYLSWKDLIGTFAIFLASLRITYGSYHASEKKAIWHRIKASNLADHYIKVLWFSCSLVKKQSKRGPWHGFENMQVVFDCCWIFIIKP